MNFAKVLQEATPLLLDGLKTTIIISLTSIAIGMIIGLFTCLMRMSKIKIFKAVSNVYIWIIRGTPIMVQAFLIFFAMPQIIQLTINPGFKINALTAGIITLSLNAGAYLSEIFRAGIQAVPKGQTEAARSLGMTQAKALSKVVLPQAFKISIPSLVNQFIITIKDSSILSVIGLAEVVNKAKTYVGSTFAFFPTYILVALAYLAIISVLMVISNYVEKKLSYDKQS